MTREREIKTQARLYSPNDIGVQAAFEESARWADRTMIDKGCKWLSENFRVSSFDDTKIVTHFSSMFDVLASFRKAKKGGEE